MSGTRRRRIAGEAKPEIQSEPVEAPKPRVPTLRRSGGWTSSDDAKATLRTPVPAPATVEPSPTVEHGTSSPLGGLRSPKALALIGLLVVSIAFGVFGIVSGVQSWRADDPSVTRRAAEDAAATAAETIFSYQYNKLPQHLSESEATMTPAFAKKFKSISPALKALAPQRRIQVRAVVRNAATIECGESCSPDKASVLIFIDQARVADGVTKPTVFGNRIQVSMVNRNNRWLVSNIKAL